MDQGIFEQTVIESLGDLPDTPRQAHEFASHFYYQSHDVNDTEHYVALRKLQDDLCEKYDTQRQQGLLPVHGSRIFRNHCQTPQI